MPVANIYVDDAATPGTPFEVQGLSTTIGDALIAILTGKRAAGTYHPIALNDDDSVKTAPAAARQHWYSTSALAAAASTSSTPDGADDWSRVTGYIIVTWTAGNFATGDFVLEVQQCRNDTFAAGTYEISAFTAKDPTVTEPDATYPAYARICKFDVQRMGTYVKLVLTNNGATDFDAMNAEAMLVTVVR